MSPNEKQAELERGVKLCQLVHERQIDNEIGEEIRRLLEEGVVIDFQDQNRNKKTAIHLAVEKGDVICVKFLLQFKPRLELKDEDGKTPIDLAENQNILSVLLNSTVEIVNESYVEVIDFGSITRHKIEAIKLRPTFKVLKLINCPSVNKVWVKLNDQDHASTFNDTSHLFLVTIETIETSIDNDHELMKKVLNSRRPMIVQLSSSKSQEIKIFFKDERKDFVEITDPMQITQKQFDEAVKCKDECNFKLLVAALRSNILGQCTGDLLDTKLNTNRDQREAGNHFATSNALCHRFFKLFDEALPDTDRIKATLSATGDQSLLALLDLPFKLNEEELRLTEYQQDLLSVVDTRDYNLLMIAAELSNLAAIKLLLRCGCDFNHIANDGYRASDICWEVDAFDNLAELIEADSPYPYHYSTDELDESSEAFKRIDAVTEAVNSFHENIKDGEIEEVKKFIASRPHIKHAYDTQNLCALTVALQANQVTIYSMLMSEGFEPGIDDEYHSACLKSTFKNKIRNSHKKYFKEAFDEPHLKRLLKMYRLSFGSKDRAKCSTIIRNMFDELNEIDEIIPILKICSLSEKLRIVFDFNCAYVLDMVVETGSRSLGIVYPSEGIVYIGAKNHETEFFKVIGALIHELTHYAMRLTYGNSCKPYDEDDNENKERFKEITRETKKICDENISTDSIVRTVFRETLYGEEVWHKELIVRVPQLLAYYKINSKAVKAAERITPELFHFYREKTLKDVQTRSNVLLQKYLISKINKQTGTVRKIKSLNVKFENVMDIDLKSVNVITSNAPQLTLAMLHQNDCDSSHIFTTLEQVANGNVLEKIAKANAKKSSAALIVDCFGLTQKYPKSVRKLLKSFKNMKTIALVMNKGEGLNAKKNFSNVELQPYTHSWNELTEDSKDHLLNQNVIFQGVVMKLNELVEPSSSAMNSFPLANILKCEDFKIGHELHQPMSHNFYIERKLSKNYQSQGFDELFRFDTKMSVMIISDDAGSGKSVTLFEIAKFIHQLHPARWVLFVDLKRHIEAFKSIENYEMIESFHGFIMQHILKKEPEFDQGLFLQMFRAGKTFVLFDGFDEISPNYKDLLLHVLNLLDPGSGNQFFITTRPHLEADLEGALGKFVYRLDEISEENRLNFLREYWQSVEFEISQEDFEVLSKRMLEKFSKIETSKLIGLPLLMRMTAEIFEDPNKEKLMNKVESLSITSVFQKFVEKYFARWKYNENEISRNENVEFVMSGGVLEVHHSIAINHIFHGEFENFIVDESDAEKISRVGLIRYDKRDKSFQFIHETFAEYFVANFICFHLSRLNRDQSHECSKAIQALCKIFVGTDFKVIKTFLDQTLEATKFSPSESVCKYVAKSLSEVLRSRNRFDFLVKSLQSSANHLKSVLLSIVEHVEKDVLLKIFQSNSSIDGSALLFAVRDMSKSIVSFLCNLITSCTDDPKEIFSQEERSFFGNVLLTAAQNKNDGVLTTLSDSLNSVLTRDEIKIMFEQKNKYGQNIIAIASAEYNGSDETFLELVSLLPNYFSPDEIRSLLLAVDLRFKETFFSRALTRDTNESLKVKFKVVQSNFTIGEQKSFFYQPATAPHMFHYAAENQNTKRFETIIESIRDVLSKDDIKLMLMAKKSGGPRGGSNVLHIIAGHGNEVVLNELNSLLRERLSDDDIKSLLLEVTEKGQNCFRLAANSTKINLQIFCEIIGNLTPIEDQTRLLQQSIDEIDTIRLACGNYNTNEVVPVETIKYLMTQKKYFRTHAVFASERQGLSAFQAVASEYKVETWNKLTSFAQASFSVDEMKGFLCCCDNAGANCLHLAISYNIGNENMIKTICETIKNLFSVEDQKKFVRHTDSDKKNVFHLAAMKIDMVAWKSLFDGVSSILSQNEVKEMLKEKYSDGVNILGHYRKYSLVKKVKRDLLPFLQTILTSDEIKNLLFDVDGERKNLFQCAVEFATDSKLESISEAIKENLSRDEQKKFFGIKSPNVFDLAAKNFMSKIFSTLHECLKDVLTKDEIKALIQEKNSENRNILLLICHRNESDEPTDANRLKEDHEVRLRDFVQILKDVCDADELRNILTSMDISGSNCLLLAAQLKDQLFFKELLSFIRRELSIDDQQSLVLKCDNDGCNIFTRASFNKAPETLFFIKQFLKEIISETQIEELMIRHEEMKN